ncbi:hypothetical protein KIL84_000558 [Mauremys mutica]|uniref:Uncharacterized protein n=1 Tax=Mauremys mutica TaxID=74926 RepID=A0A9D4ASU9_9SAUR|nr:hypothetical protein KIL84_000558 [Mauremys mutica]
MTQPEDESQEDVGCPLAKGAVSMGTNPEEKTLLLPTQPRGGRAGGVTLLQSPWPVSPPENLGAAEGPNPPHMVKVLATDLPHGSGSPRPSAYSQLWGHWPM